MCCGRKWTWTFPEDKTSYEMMLTKCSQTRRSTWTSDPSDNTPAPCSFRGQLVTSRYVWSFRVQSSIDCRSIPLFFCTAVGKNVGTWDISTRLVFKSLGREPGECSCCQQSLQKRSVSVTHLLLSWHLSSLTVPVEEKQLLSVNLKAKKNNWITLLVKYFWGTSGDVMNLLAL